VDTQDLRDDGTYQFAAPERLPERQPLQEVILGRDCAVWIRTAYEQLYPEPCRLGGSISYVYSGSGPDALAILLDRLMDDINAPAPARRDSDPAEGLIELTETDWPVGTMITRTQLPRRAPERWITTT
jgi:hypothetical protein